MIELLLVLILLCVCRPLRIAVGALFWIVLLLIVFASASHT
jgi:hypothetical protein